MTAWRCSPCDVDWPFGSNYRKCPVCKKDTWEATGTQSLGFNEAQKLAKEMLQEIEDHKKQITEHQRKHAKAHAEFEKWYEEREVEKFRSQLDSAKLC